MIPLPRRRAFTAQLVKLRGLREQERDAWLRTLPPGSVLVETPDGVRVCETVQDAMDEARLNDLRSLKHQQGEGATPANRPPHKRKESGATAGRDRHFE